MLNLKIENLNITGTHNLFKPVIKNKQQENIFVQNCVTKTSLPSGYALAMMKGVSFRAKENSFVPEYEKKLIGEIPTNEEAEYYDMVTASDDFYVKAGKDINNFLRTGVLRPVPDIDEDLDEEYKYFLGEVIRETRDYNRCIVDSIKHIDERMYSVIDKPTIVYRDCPADWMETAKDGLLTDKAYVSTSLTPGASFEYMIGYKPKNDARYEILLPVGAKYMDLTHTQEKEVVLPRNSKFKVVGDYKLELVV